ncbi:ShlB/FhaC/HecB family hemolysin secretion/activation protein [Tsuneonella deserti]|uniref:ShlB/FhaC/HecB family hemolysin secretion/activation protein n=1 Tax=Tsuneonella deserti TaxID=2035528 RepID=UPI00166B9DB7|nr:ShlB/FhaC/HecB family hemolysin secretion/activation protein [Tsuneonella deserti]
MALGSALALIPAAAAHAQAGPVPSRDDLSVGRDTALPTPTRLSVKDDIERGPCPLAEPAFANARVTFSAIEFTGLPGVPAADLAPSWTEFANRDLPITALCEVRDRAATMLRARGFLAAVQIPPQRIEKGGVARMDVLAAKLTELQVRGDAGAAEGLIASHLEPLTREEWFNTNDATRNLLLLRDLPGYDARLTLRSAGRAPGEVVGDITVDYTPIELTVGAQNLGAKATGREGLFAELALNGLLGLGDRTTASIYNTVDWDEQRIIRLGEEIALGANGLRLGGSVLWGRSEPSLAGGGFLTKTFAAEGHLRAVLQRRRTSSLALTGGLELVDQKLSFAGTRLSEDDLSIAFLRLDHAMIDAASASGRDGFSPGEPKWRSALSLELRKGLGIFGASHDCSVIATCRPPNIPISNALADPRALVARLDGAIEYRPVPRVTLALLPLVQVADHALLAYEQASLGNYTIGRGLDPGVVVGDDAVGASFEVRAGSRYPGANGGFAFEPFAFVDWARTWIHDNRINPDPRDVLTAGAGVRGRWGEHFDIGLTFAAPLKRAGYQLERSDPRLLFTIAARLLPWGDR